MTAATISQIGADAIIAAAAVIAPHAMDATAAIRVTLATIIKTVPTVRIAPIAANAPVDNAVHAAPISAIPAPATTTAEMPAAKSARYCTAV